MTGFAFYHFLYHIRQFNRQEGSQFVDDRLDDRHETSKRWPSNSIGKKNVT